MADADGKYSGNGLEIAVVGMAGKFPGANTIEEFWQNIRNGIETISHFTDEELIESGIEPILIKNPNYVKAKGFIKDVEYFDPEFFSYSPREAEIMDPQIRLLQECSWEALEDAGYDPKAYKGSIGLYVGAASNINWVSKSPIINSNSDTEKYEAGTLCYKDAISTLTSYKLDLTGPSFTIYTACSTSMVTIHLASRALLMGECSMALAGGVSVSYPKKAGYVYNQGMTSSPDGHCRAFDAEAKGTVFGDGVGIVVLKRLEDAIEAGDNIYAIIKGSSINNDGARRVGYTAPSVEGQVEVIKAAQHMAECEIESINYIETHGTATNIGDPIELEALKQAFDTDKIGTCAIGSVKTNVGHLDTASGVTSFIKTVMALKNQEIPPSLNFERPNPKINLVDSPFYINTELAQWARTAYPRRAGVSSFGLGGTNAHAILEEAPPKIQCPEMKKWKLILLSARSSRALQQYTDNLAEYFISNKHINLSDAAYTLQVGRRAWNYREMIVASDIDDAVRQLKSMGSEDSSNNSSFEAKIINNRPNICFMFPDTGFCCMDMAGELYKSEEVFREEINHYFDEISRLSGDNLRELFLSLHGDLSEERLATQQGQLLALAVQWATAKTLLKWGGTPNQVSGIGFGVISAAYISGILSIEAAIKLALLNIKLKEKTGGSKAKLSYEEVRQNYWELLNKCEDKFQSITLNAPEVPLISTMTGVEASRSELSQYSYWYKLIFDNKTEVEGNILYNKSDTIYLSFDTKIMPIKENIKNSINQLTVIKEKADPLDASQYLLGILGKVWCLGGSIDWSKYYSKEKRYRISLPKYPFEKQRYWIDAVSGSQKTPLKEIKSQVIEKTANINEWFYIPVWKEEQLPVSSGSIKSRWLVFADLYGISDDFVNLLVEKGNEVITVRNGGEFLKESDSNYYINLKNSQHYINLFEELISRDKFPKRIAHFCSISQEQLGEELLEYGYYSLINMSKGIVKQDILEKLDIAVITNNIYRIKKEDIIHPEQTMLLAPCKILPQEKIGITCRSIDIGNGSINTRLFEKLYYELLQSNKDTEIAYRGEQRWIKTYENLQKDAIRKTLELSPEEAVPQLKDKGVYLITGGLGGVGFKLAEYLAKAVKGRLILLGRTQLPPRSEWQSYLDNLADEDDLKIKIKKVLKLEELGADVLVIKADVADPQQMEAALLRAEEKYGSINGIIHGAGILRTRSAQCMMESISREESLEQFNPKIGGLQILNDLIKEKQLDFCILVSSLSPILGGLGHVAYAAANLFLDAFAEKYSYHNPKKWISVNWGDWQYTEKAVQKLAFGESLERVEMTPEEGVRTFQCILSLNKEYSQVVISAGDLMARYNQWVRLEAFQNINASILESSNAGKVLNSKAIEELITGIWKDFYRVDYVSKNSSFFELGATSLDIIQINTKLIQALGRHISLEVMFEYPNITSLAKHLSQEDMELAEDVRMEPIGRAESCDIAVIGMAGRFPGAKNVEEFWTNLIDGKESIRFFTEEELIEAGISSETLRNPNYVKAKGFMEDIEYFDATFFDYSPQDVEMMDPQIRIFHECSWAALENAGYNPENYEGLIGMYAGATPNLYWEVLTTMTEARDAAGQFSTAILNDKDSLSTKVSYKLNLKGPSVTIFTGCSTSLVAIDSACQAIWNGHCDMALAGGITITLPNKSGYTYQEGMLFSSDGHCRSFDAKGDGMVFANGAGVVVLKPLKAAIKDGDNIYAVVKGSATNNDGNRKVGYTSPSVKGQIEVIRTAQRMANIEPETVSYIEAHGTATKLGDPIEIKALKQAFNTDKKGFCRIGTVKSNMGHLMCASGVAGFIKASLALKNRLIPPSINYDTPNQEIDFENSPFVVNTKLTQWYNEQYPLRAGVSSFGIGGTNAHVVLEEAPAVEESSDTREWKIIMLSSKTEGAMERITEDLKNYLERNSSINLADAAYTLQVGRREFRHRKAIVCRDTREAIEILSARDDRKLKSCSLQEDGQSIVFMFPGQGSQYVNMARDLYEKELVFHNELNNCLEILKSLKGYDLKEILYPETASEESLERINSTDIAQPLVFAIEYAIAKLLMKWGLKPDAMIGYSFGEYVAAHIAGVLSLEDALRLIVARGNLMSTLPKGAMLSVPLPEDELKILIEEFNKIYNKENYIITIAVDNGNSCIVAGGEAAISSFESYMKSKKYLCMRVKISLASHSSEMNAIIEAFENEVRSVKLNKPQVPYISNITGRWIKDEEAVDPMYWVRHMKETVRFADGIKTILEEYKPIFIEIGPGRDLRALVNRFMDDAPEKILNTLRPSQKEISDVFFLINQLANLWMLGVKVDWKSYYDGEIRYRIPLPTYSFERQKYWLEGNPFEMVQNGLSRKNNSLYKKHDISEWFYLPQWSNKPITTYPSDRVQKQRWLVFTTQLALTDELILKLKNMGKDVVTVAIGEHFQIIENNYYVINPEVSEDYQNLFTTLSQQDRLPHQILHLWGISEESETEITEKQVEAALELGFYSLLYTAKAIGKQKVKENIQIAIITNNMHRITGDERVNPAESTVMGPAMVIPQEYPYLNCQSIDITIPAAGTKKRNKLIEDILEELQADIIDKVVAYRGGCRWIQQFQQIKLEEPQTEKISLRENGVYLITGGTGGIGLILAEHLARKSKARLVLVSRSKFPERKDWDNWLSVHGSSDAISKKITKIMELESIGAKVLIASADVADYTSMEKVISEAEACFGSINGVIHGAGILGGPSFNTINELSKTDCQLQFSAKIYGLLNLKRLLDQRELDFCLLMSSIATVLGGLGYTAYAASNIFMDAFVQSISDETDTPWICVNWSDWKYWSEEENNKPLGTVIAELSMEPEEGIKIFERILAWGKANRIANSPGDLQLRINQWINLESLNENEDNNNDVSTYHNRPDLHSLYVAPATLLEKRLEDIWERLFRIRQIGIEDDFLELGGDSLKAITVISKIHKELNVEISLPQFFNNPTIKGLAEYVNNASTCNYASIELAEEKEYYPLSSSQFRMYALTRMDTDSTAYNDPMADIMEGALDIEKVKTAFQMVIDRHEILRTSIEMIGNEPMQKVHNNVSMNIEYHIANEEAIDEILKNFVRPFDLSKAPLLRVGLIKIHETKHMLLMDMHHIITDGASYDIFVRDFMSFYGDEELPQLAIQYKDYAQWQYNEKQGGVIKKQEEYWVQKFQGELPVLDMPTDYPRPVIQKFEGDFVNIKIDKEKIKNIKYLEKKLGVTLHMVLLAAYNTLLMRYTGQEDIIVGTLIAGRSHIDLQNIIGPFITTLPLRCTPEKGKTLLELLEEVKATCLEAYANSDYQFEELINRLQIKRDASRNPMFDTALLLQNMKAPELSIEGIVFKPYYFKKNVALLDLRIVAVENDEEIEIEFEYSTNLFSQNTIERMAEHFTNILVDGVNNPEKKLTEINMLSQQEINRILIGFNSSTVDFAKDKTVYQLVEEYADKCPAATAISYGDKKLSFEELNQQSNKLAHFISNSIAGRDQRVGILMERSDKMVISILAIWKAGGAYIPLDPSYPLERIDGILKDSGAVMLITESSYIDTAFKEQYDGRIVKLDEDYNSISNCDVSNLNKENDMNGLAYVIYTSGSTGKPKGAMVEHIGMMNHMYAKINDLNIDYSSILAQNASHCFDISVWQFFAAIIAGGQTCIYADDIVLKPNEFINKVIEDKITILEVVPSYLSVILDYLEEVRKELPSIKYLLTTGEIVKPNQVKRWFETYPNTKLVNAYGPTEASDDITHHIIEKAADMERVPIGKPVQNFNIYIVDENMNLCPIGIKGEICVSGIGVGRGYLNDELRTAQAFMEDPFIKEHSVRLYKTGDLGRWLPDGSIDFFGRKDYQVKIRGFRIELGEIESKLSEHPDIREAVVIDSTDKQGSKYLCAYIVTNNILYTAEIKEFLATSLPDYMIPQHYVELDKIPLNANGKVDRKALPKHEYDRSASLEYTAPESEIEEILADTWSEVLGLDKVGVNDNFFQIGGDSIKAMQISARLQRYKYKVELNDIFLHSTIKQLAKCIKKIERAIDQQMVKGIVPLTPIQKWFFENNFNAKHHYNQSIMLFSEAGFNEEIVKGVFNKVLEHHDALRMSYREEGEKVVQYNRGMEGILFNFYTKVILKDDTFEDILEDFANTLQVSLDLENGPLAGIGLIHTNIGDYLLVVIHHIVADGITWRILLEDFEEGYKQACEGKEIQFQEKSDSFKYWAEKLNQYAESESALSELAYWEAVEKNEIKKLPRDYNVDENKKNAGNVELISIELEKEEFDGILKKTNWIYNAEANDILLTALALAINEWCGHKKILVNLEGHGREDIIEDMYISRTIGWFTSQFPVVLDVSEGDNLSDKIRNVKESMNNIPNKGIGYGILRYLTPEEKRKGISLTTDPEINFNYLGQFEHKSKSGLFKLIDMKLGETKSRIRMGNIISSTSQRNIALNVEGDIVNDKLVMSFGYNRYEYNSSTIKVLAELFKKYLGEMAEHLKAKEYYPLSWNQKGIYVLDKLLSVDDAFNIAYTAAIDGKIDIERFERIFRILVERHEAFRTSFQLIDGEPIQKVHKQVDFQIEYSEASGVEPQEIIRRFVKPFDLTKAPLLRVGIIKIAENRHLLIADMHHIISDGASLNILFKEFESLYKGDELTALNVQYKDFAMWQLEMLKSKKARQMEEYWINKLSGELPKLDLPYDFVPNDMSDFEADVVNFTIPNRLISRLRRLGEKQKVTMHTVLFAAYSILLSKYTAQEDIIIGSISAGRFNVDLENVIGAFVNLLPIRLEVKSNTEFLEHLNLVNKALVDAYKNQNYPIDEILDKLKLSKKSSATQLFNTVMTFHNEFDSISELNIEDMTFRSVNTDRFQGGSDIQLDIYIEPNDDMKCYFQYNKKLFSKDTIKGIINHYINIIEKLSKKTNIKLSEIEMLSESEKQQIIYEFNNKKAEIPIGKTVHQLFEECALNDPDRNALFYKDIKITYRELNEKANQIARYLISTGTSNEELVAVLLDRSPLIVESIMGIWKAGGAYIPIDPDYPSDRIKVILEESKTNYLLTESKFVTEDIEKEYSGKIIKLDKHMDEILKEAVNDLDLPVKSDSLAYVIYTSGSTGKPKGAMIEHIGMLNHILAEIAELNITKASVIAQNASHCFDISVWQFFAALTIGAATAIYPNELVMTPDKFTQKIIEDGVSILEAVPSFINLMLDYIEESSVKLDKLDYLMITGEAVTPSIVKRSFDVLKKIYVVNAYGPAEAADDITQYIMDSPPVGDNVPIGKPIQNMHIYIVDKDMNLCPIGVKGEICVAGIGVGRGYLNNPERTSSVFLINPFLPEENMRLYRIGDLGRWLPDGNLEFVGRSDYQVKIRGFRIELGEIESSLLEHEGVKEAAVVVKETEDDKYLCAYFTAEGDLIDREDLEKFLSEKLPYYMIPTYFVQLPQLPLSPNGKIDRKALTALELSYCNLLQGSEDNYLEPTNEVEKKLEEIWKAALKLDRVSIKDDFFKLGGNSLKAIIVTTEIKKGLNREVSVRELFRTPTIRDIAQYILKTEESAFSTIKAIEKRTYYPTSYVQKRLFALAQLEEDSTTYNIPIAVMISGNLTVEKARKAFKNLVARHEALRTSIKIIDGEIVQQIHENIEFDIEYILAGESSVKSIVDKFIRPFNMNNPPLIRATIIKVEENKHILLFDIHHIISDAVSNEILIKEFLSCYKGEDLYPLNIQYKDFAVWHNKLLESDYFKKQEEYWVSNFSDTIPRLNMPTDYERPAVQNFEGERIHFEAGIELTEKLKHLAQETGTTMYMLLIAAYKALLANITCQEDIVVGTPVMGRSHADLHNIVGMFVNMLVIRTYPERNKTFADYLLEAKETLLKAYEHQDYQYDMLLDKLKVRREQNRNPLFDVAFAYQDSTENEVNLGELKFEPYHFEYRISKFDMTLYANEDSHNITFDLEYSVSLFKQENIDSLIKRYLEVLSVVADNRFIKINELVTSSIYKTIIEVEDVEFNF